ncbi:hypothetical protein R9C00_16910 [Flammeovirgaceae bacterium SG7u.111]|nr:hypothetical protein [Flammeovirgaceae bacterium SG7u.132]WPO33381.1 hypothetical protein R9C00_16910 [Flammeovirgaceae bacterium SG7u.111]
MKKYVIIAIFLLIIASFGYYKFGLFTGINYFTALSDISKGKVEILTYGFVERTDEELNPIAKQFGFQFKTMAGCVVTQRFINQVDSYNYAVERYLEKRNGENWLGAFNKEVEKELPRK